MKSFTKINYGLLSAMIMFIAISCKKSDTPQPTTQELIQGKSWKLSALTINPALNGTTDYLNGIMQPCERDNVYTFGYSLLWQGFYLDESTTLCDPAYPIYYGTWTFNDTTKVISFSYGSSTTGLYQYSMTVEGVSENGFTGKTTETISGNIYAKIWTFTRN